MATIQLEAQITPEALISAVRQLMPVEQEEFARRFLALRAEGGTAAFSLLSENELIERILAVKSAAFQKRLKALNRKRREFTLTPEEHAELIRMNDETETYDAQRLEYLAELSRRKNQTIPALMQSLGLKAPDYA